MSIDVFPTASDMLLQSFDAIADSPGGVARLRALILHLAVRGMLVPQDPADEPASVLLERIRAEQRRTTTHGGRTTKAQRNGNEKQCHAERSEASRGAAMQDNETPFALPNGWAWTRLADVLVSLQTGPFGSNLHKEDYIDSGIPVINPASIKNEQIVPIKRMTISSDTKARLSEYTLYKGDIILGRRGEMGRCAEITEREEGWLCGTGSLVLRFDEQIWRPFVIKFFASDLAKSYLLDSSVGSTMNNLNQRILLNLPFPLPPLAEQRRIVARVDALLALCDALEAQQTQQRSEQQRLQRVLLAALTAASDADAVAVAWQRLADSFDMIHDTPDSVAALRQAVLQLAVQGRLVAQDAADEPAGVLLEEIAKDKERLIAAGQINKPAPLPCIEASEISSNSPNGWEWERLGNLAKFIDYRGHTPPKTNEGVKLITAKNVRMGYINNEPYEYISETTYNKWMTRGFPRFGDVLFTTEAPLGYIAPLLTEERVALAQRVIDLQPFASLDGAYLKFALMSPLLQDAIQDKSSGMTATGIKASRLKLILLPIPPLAEQRRIVARVDALMAQCDALEAGLRAAQAASERLAAALTATR